MRGRMMLNKKEYNRWWYRKNKEKKKEYSRQYRKENPEKVRKYSREYREENREQLNKYSRQWYQANKKQAKESHRRWQKEKRRIDLKHNLSSNISRVIRRSLKSNKKSKHWESLVGYSLNDLILHLQKTMPEGYTWQDYMNGKLHIDHIIPVSAFNFSSPEHIDFKRCWTLKNLRLLPARENLVKHNKLDKPFQTTLTI